MFLKQIKISGFKSFVTPTTIYFRSDRVAIVGPNGCGKSNIIDAIRWVMGESSARFLRGDLMSDVIFNGSVNRKPVGMASVEIIFDNHAAYLQGAHVVQGDLSLRREMNRAGESSYYMNGKKVRRKDLSDLWLGTGAGARGYAIIGQNMVHQLVEANPEVIRGYLEEAAGVSKYKDRRKESVERLTQVQENLLRIADLRCELQQQLERLTQEAQAAELYHGLRQHIRQSQEQLCCAQAREYDTASQRLQQKIQVCTHDETRVQVQSLQLQENIKNLVTSVDTEQKALVSQEQSIFKARIELEQMEKEYLQRQQESQRLQREVEDSQLQLEREQALLLERQQDMVSLRTKLAAVETKTQEVSTACEVQRQQLRDWQEQRLNLKQQLADKQNQIHVLKLKQEQAELNLQRIRTQMQHWLENINKYNPEWHTHLQILERELAQKQQDVLQLTAEKKYLEEQEQLQQQRLFEAQRSKSKVVQEMEAARHDYLSTQSHYQGLLSSFVAEDESGSQSIQTWLQQWQIPESWQMVVDCLWQRFLPARLLAADHLKSMATGYSAAMQSVQQLSDNLANRPNFLSVMGMTTYPAGFMDWQDIWVADSREQAWEFYDQLQGQQSLITVDGLWLGLGWVYVLSPQTSQQGLATRLRELQIAEQHYQQITLQLEQWVVVCNDLAQEHQRWVSQLSLKQHALDAVHASVATGLQEIKLLQQKIQICEQEQIRAQTELVTCEQQLSVIEKEQEGWHLEQQQHLQDLTRLEQQEQQLLQDLRQLDVELQQQDKILSVYKAEHTQHHLAINQSQTEQGFYLKNIPVLQGRLEEMMARQLQVQQWLATVQLEQDFAARWEELHRDQKQLELRQQACHQHRMTQTQLQSQFDALKQQETQILEKKWRLHAEQEQLTQKIENLTAQLATEFSPSLWQHLSQEQDVHYFKQRIATLERELQRVGDVNLLAIGLLEQEQARVEQLLQQEDDLQTAMAELQIAIETLDKQMQQCLQVTLDAINVQLTKIFPQLFGGGEAKFVATCDNLLEATMIIQVQLPGKKLHRIQLLSGGEKALTAVAMLFAIFSLNPAPFCLLDEVDAALDDANVLRLSALIKNMSNTLQFIVITHNVLMMDVAEELIGITMQEPGVSSVVTVNLATALAMANKE